MLDRLPKIFRNFYFVTGVLFLLYFTFFSDPNLIEQIKRYRGVKDLQKEKKYYQEHREKVLNDRNSFQSDTVLLEKVAREKYYMRRENEDVYIIERTKSKK
jgi:cell division protein FtsB